MCLLVVCSRVVPGLPLVVASNRDEDLLRPASPTMVLDEGPPVILGGRDDRAGGTWLAVNGAGVIAGLTNQPSAAGRDPNRRSRGELPLLLAGERSAPKAVAAFSAGVDPSCYNPAWLLVGDRRSLSYIEINGAGAPLFRSLGEGTYVLENRPIDATSGKVDRVRELLDDPSALPLDRLIERLVLVLSDHATAPDGGLAPRSDPGGVSHRPACIHGERYGTRSSTIVLVAEEPGPITVLVADGQPCSTPFRDVSGLFTN